MSSLEGSTAVPWVVIGPGAIGSYFFLLVKRILPAKLLYRTVHQIPPKLILKVRHDLQEYPHSDLEAMSWDSELDVFQHPYHALVFTKSFDVRGAVKSLVPYLNNCRSLVLASNGLSVVFEIIDLLPRELPVLRMLCEFGCQREEETIVYHGGSTVRLAAKDNCKDWQEWYSEQLAKVGLEVVQEKSIAIAEWRKALTNIVINPLCVLTESENRYVLPGNAGHARAREILQELLRIAEAERIYFPELTEKRFFDSLEPYASNRNSSLIDYLKKRPTEIPHLLGRALRIAESHGVSTPSLMELAVELSQKTRVF